MFTAKALHARPVAHAREVTAEQNSTSGGVRDTEVNELMVSPTGSRRGCGR
jgi:hypothetical protein